MGEVDRHKRPIWLFNDIYYCVGKKIHYILRKYYNLFFSACKLDIYTLYTVIYLFLGIELSVKKNIGCHLKIEWCYNF